MIRVNADGTPYTRPKSAKQAIDLAYQAGKAVADAGGTKEAVDTEMVTTGLRLAKQMYETGFSLLAARVENTFTQG